MLAIMQILENTVTTAFTKQTTRGQSNLAKAALNIPILYNGQNFPPLPLSLGLGGSGLPNKIMCHASPLSKGLHPKQDVNPFSHFCTTQPHDRQTSDITDKQ